METSRQTKNITGVIHNLPRGGAEKNFAALFNYLSATGYCCSIICLNPLDPKHLPLAPDIKITSLSTSRLNIFKRINALRESINQQQPDCIISFMDQTNMLCILALGRHNSIPLVVCERNNPRHNLVLGRKFPFFLQIAARWLRTKMYNCASRICCQTEGAAQYFREHCKNIQCTAIPNFVEPAAVPLSNSRPKNILCVARLVPEKGLHEVIVAFSKLIGKFPDWHLKIYGNGPQETELRDSIDKLGLSKNIEIHPKVEDLAPVYSEASIFVLNSKYEGFPNALLEAMSYGLVPIATECDFGPAEIIQPGINGFTVPVGSTSQLYDKLELLVSDPDLRNSLSELARHIDEKYSRSRFNREFEELIQQVIGLGAGRDL